MKEEKKEALRREFSALLDNELDPETRATVEAELAVDADSLRELETLKRLDDLYRALHHPTAPDDFEARVHAALQSNVVPLSRYRNVIRWSLSGLAAASVLIVVSVLYIRDYSPAGTQFQVSKAPATTAVSHNESDIKHDDNSIQEELQSQTPPESPPFSLSEGSSDSESRMEADSAEPKTVDILTPEAGEKVLGREMNAEPMPKISYEISNSPQESMAPEALPGSAIEMPKSTLAAPSEASNIAATPPPLVTPVEAPTKSSKDVSEKKQTEGFTFGGKTMGLISKEAAIGSTTPKNSHETPGRQLVTIKNRIQLLREYRENVGESGEKQEQAEARTVSERSFRLEQAIWVESTYRNEDPIYLELGSEAYMALLQDYPQLSDFETLGPFVLLSVNGAWYFIYQIEIS